MYINLQDEFGKKKYLMKKSNKQIYKLSANRKLVPEHISPLNILSWKNLKKQRREHIKKKISMFNFRERNDFQFVSPISFQGSLWINSTSENLRRVFRKSLLYLLVFIKDQIPCFLLMNIYVCYSNLRLENG